MCSLILTDGDHLQMSALQLPLQIRQRIGLTAGAVLLVVDLIAVIRVRLLLYLHDGTLRVHLALLRPEFVRGHV